MLALWIVPLLVVWFVVAVFSALLLCRWIRIAVGPAGGAGGLTTADLTPFLAV